MRLSYKVMQKEKSLLLFFRLSFVHLGQPSLAFLVNNENNLLRKVYDPKKCPQNNKRHSRNNILDGQLKKCKAFIYYVHSYIQLKSCDHIKLEEMFPGSLLFGYSDLHGFTRIRKSYKIHWDTKYSPRGNILSW